MSFNPEYFRSIFEKNFTWIGGFMRNVRRYPDSTALIDPVTDTKWSYTDLNHEVNRLANAFLSHGVGKGDVVFYQLYNSPQFAFCYIAPQKIGAVNSPVNCNLAAGETARMLERDKPVIYVYDSEVQSMVLEALTLSSHHPSCVIEVNHHNDYSAVPAGHIAYIDFISDASDSDPDIALLPGMYDESTRMCTSGTTGTPKGVPLCQANEVMSAHDSIMHFPLTPKDITMNLTPWFHRGGLHSGGLNPTLYCGGCVVILRMFNAKTAFAYTEKYHITFLIGVPSALSKLADRQEKHPADISSLKGIVTMGSPLEKADCQRYQQVLTPNIFNGYGTTETFWNCFLRPYDLPEMAGSAGKSCTDDEVRVVHMYEDHKAAPDDTVPCDGVTEGEIIISAWAKSGLCYQDAPEQTAEKYDGSWYYTKDVGTWDKNQYVTLCGRRDDMIICMGENIYPSQLEEVICLHPGVKDCMVVGVPDASRGEAVACYAVVSDPELTIKDLHHFCVSSPDISGYKCPRYYCITDTLPYSSTGKKLHAGLKKQAADDLMQGKLLRP